MQSQRMVQTVALAAVSLFLVGALTGCPLLLGGDQAGKVSFVASPSSGPAPLAVHFYGMAVLAPPYEAQAWVWDFGDGSAGNGRSTVHTYPVPGTYTVTLDVSAAAPKFRGQQDPPPATLTYSGMVNVLNPNRPPTANAGPDQSVFLPTGAQSPPVQLDGSGSSDPDGDPLTYAWSFVSVPAGSAAALTGPNTVNPTFRPDRKGNYVIQLIVNDGKLDSEPDTVVITVGNRPPVANAGPDQTGDLGIVGQTPPVILDGSGSSDPDGDTITYAWSFVSVPVDSTATLTGANTVSPTFTPDLKGDYVVQLIVNDGTVDSAPDTVTVTIGNRPPTAVGVVLPDNKPTGNVYKDTTSPVLTANLDTLYGVPRWNMVEYKAFGPPYPLFQIDPDTAEITGTIPITLILDAGGYLLPLIVDQGKGLAVDPTNGEMWAILGFRPYYMTSGDWWALARLNPYSGVAVAVDDPMTSSLPILYTDLAVDLESLVYGATGNSPQKVVDQDHALYEIDKIDTSDTFILQFPEPPDVNFTPGEVIAFNNDDGLMYHASGSYDTEAERLFETLDLDTLALTAVPITPVGQGEWFWRRPSAMTYAWGASQFYLADNYEVAELFRLTLSGGVVTQESIGIIGVPDEDYAPPIEGLAFLFDRAFPAPEVTVDGSGSSDPDGDSLTYAWQFVAVPQQSAITNSDLSDLSVAMPTFTPDVLGTYVLKLEVSDGELSDTATVFVNYLNTPPVANAGADQVLPGQLAVQINGGDSYDPDGDVLTFVWTVLSVPDGSSINDASLAPGTTAAAPTFFADVADNAEPYVLQLTVTDADGETSTDTVEILIEELNK